MNALPSLQKYVVLGFTDVAASGCRALLGVDLSYYSDAEKVNYQIPAQDGLRFLDVGLVSCKGGTDFDDAFNPIQVVNIPSKNVSLVIVNCRPSWKFAHVVINALVQMLAKNRLEVLYVLAAISSPKFDTNLMFEMNLFKEKTKDLPHPPDTMKSCDGFFNQLVQFVHVEKIPTSFFILTAKKAKEGHASRDDGTLTVIQTMQALAEELTGIKFNLLTSRELFYSENKEMDFPNTNSMYL